VAEPFSAYPPVIWILLLGAGILIGLLAGLLGVGGGIVAVPLLLEVFTVMGLGEGTAMALAHDRDVEQADGPHFLSSGPRASQRGGYSARLAQIHERAGRSRSGRAHARSRVVLRGGAVAACALCRATGGALVGARSGLGAAPIVRPLPCRHRSSPGTATVNLALGQGGGFVFI
jgi:hypothetical protein